MEHALLDLNGANRTVLQSTIYFLTVTPKITVQHAHLGNCSTLGTVSSGKLGQPLEMMQITLVTHIWIFWKRVSGIEVYSGQPCLITGLHGRMINLEERQSFWMGSGIWMGGNLNIVIF